MLMLYKQIFQHAQLQSQTGDLRDRLPALNRKMYN